MNRVSKLYPIVAIFLSIGTTSPIFAVEPTLVFETAIPGYWLSSGHGMAADADGNSYVIGAWYENHTNLDILVIKFDAEGNPVWTVPIIGDASQHDSARDITLDADNNIWITGWTDSYSFPITPDALDNTLTGFRDAFIMKMSSEDGTILYSTYLGGDYVDEGSGIAIGATGDIYIVGSTESTDFPVTPNAYQDHPSAPLYIYSDAFITRLTAEGDSIIYSTYFGGYQDDRPRDVGLDAEGNIIFAGETTADDFPLVNPIQSAPNDLFVSRLSADGSTLQFSTYLGGSDWDGLAAMVLDSEDQVYITGFTRSPDFPTTPGAFQEEYAGEIDGCEEPFPPVPYNCEDVFVTKMATDGTGLVYSTFLGGSLPEFGRDIAVDSEGRAHVIGYTSSPDFPPGVGPGSGADIFVSRLDPTGSELDYSFIVESNSPNAGHGIAVDAAGDTYFTGAVNVPADIFAAKITTGGMIPDVTVSISSSMTQVPRNSNFLFDVSITNNDATAQGFKGWTAVQKLPSGSVYEPVLGLINFTLEPGETKTFSNVPQYVGNAPLATYRYFVRIGDGLPGQVWDEDYWDIEVIP